MTKQQLDLADLTVSSFGTDLETVQPMYAAVTNSSGQPGCEPIDTYTDPVTNNRC